MKKNSYRILSLTLAAVMLFGFTACGKKNAGDGTETGSSNTNKSKNVLNLSTKEEDDPLLDWWNGDWYGWWTMTSTSGYYEDMEGMWWDVCGTIDISSDYSGTLELWDEDYTREEPMVGTNVTLSEYGTGEYGTLYSEQGVFTDIDLEHADWIIDPGLLTTEHTIYIDGWYENGDDGYKYEFFLRPWGTIWDDVEESAWPYYYTDWYLPLVEAGEAMPDSINTTSSGSTNTAQTSSAIEKTSSTKAADDGYGMSNPNATGEATLEEMQQVYALLKDWQNTHDYQQVSEMMGSDGIPWKEQDGAWTDEKHSYKWENGEGSFLYITFYMMDGNETYFSCTYSRDVIGE